PAASHGSRKGEEAGLELKQFAAGLDRVERRVLKGSPDPQPDLARIPADVEAGDPRRPFRRSEQRAQDPDHRRLAGPVGAEEAIDLATSDRQIDTPDSERIPVSADEPANLDRRRGFDGHAFAFGGRNLEGDRNLRDHRMASVPKPDGRSPRGDGRALASRMPVAPSAARISIDSGSAPPAA